MLKYYAVLTFFIIACSSENPKTLDQGFQDMNASDSSPIQDVGKDFSEICIGLDEANCTVSGCYVVQGSKLDTEEGCFGEKVFALCSAAPQCNNGLIFHYTDLDGICWEFNGCSPREWTEFGTAAECNPNPSCRK